MGRSSTPGLSTRPSCKLIRNASCASLTRQLSKRRPGTPEPADKSPTSLPGCAEEMPSKELAAPQRFQDASGTSATSENKFLREYREVRVLGKGSFGTVRLAETESGVFVALKTVDLGRGEKCDEAHVLRSLKHPCIVALLESFETSTKRGCRAHLVMEYLPMTLQKTINGRPMSPLDCQIYSFQLFRALAYLDTLQIVHRDIKPENLLVDKSKALKLADFGSAKRLNGEKQSCNEGYFCSRWWRAPELVLGCKGYGTAVDWWSAGCVLVEMMRGQPLFCGTSAGIQLDAIAQFLGTPSVTDLKAMLQCGSISGPQLAELAKPRYSPRPWADSLPAFRDNTSALAIVAGILVYDPAARSPPGEALVHTFFSGLVNETTLPSDIFDFAAEELSSCSASTTHTLLSWKISKSEIGSTTKSATDPSQPLRRTRAVVGECLNAGDFIPPAKRFRPFAGDPTESSKSKFSFTFKPPAASSSESHVQKNDIFTSRAEDVPVNVPIFRLQSVSSDVSMGAEEMDVDI